LKYVHCRSRPQLKGLEWPETTTVPSQSGHISFCRHVQEWVS